MVDVNKLSNEAAGAIWGQFASDNPQVIKEAVKIRIGELLTDGKISKQDASRALKCIQNDALINALVGRNRTESNNLQNSLYGWESLGDSKADEIMSSAGLTPQDLFDVFPLAEGDYTIQPKELAKITDALNEKIKQNGGDKKLKKSEVERLMRSIGLNIKKSPLEILSKALGPISPLLYIIPGVSTDISPVSKIMYDSAKNSAGDEIEQQMDVIGTKASSSSTGVENDDRTSNASDKLYTDPAFKKILEKNKTSEKDLKKIVKILSEYSFYEADINMKENNIEIVANDQNIANEINQQIIRQKINNVVVITKNEVNK